MEEEDKRRIKIVAMPEGILSCMSFGTFQFTYLSQAVHCVLLLYQPPVNPFNVTVAIVLWMNCSWGSSGDEREMRFKTFIGVISLRGLFNKPQNTRRHCHLLVFITSPLAKATRVSGIWSVIKLCPQTPHRIIGGSPRAGNEKLCLAINLNGFYLVDPFLIPQQTMYTAFEST